MTPADRSALLDMVYFAPPVLDVDQTVDVAIDAIIAALRRSPQCAHLSRADLAQLAHADARADLRCRLDSATGDAISMRDLGYAISEVMED